jgi:hypothetical protein
MALAALLIVGSASAGLAQTRGAHQRRPVVRTAPPVYEQTTKPAVKPFTAEEKAWFDRASRVF